MYLRPTIASNALYASLTIAMLSSLSSYRSQNEFGDVHHFYRISGFFRSQGKIILAPGASGDEQFGADGFYFVQPMFRREGGELWEGLFCPAAGPATEGILARPRHLHEGEPRARFQDVSRRSVQPFCPPPPFEGRADRAHPSPFPFPGRPGISQPADPARIVLGHPCIHRLGWLPRPLLAHRIRTLEHT